MSGGKVVQAEKKNIVNADAEKETATEEDKPDFVTTPDGTRWRKDRFDSKRFAEAEN
jgi:hypothetical protein